MLSLAILRSLCRRGCESRSERQCCGCVTPSEDIVSFDRHTDVSRRNLKRGRRMLSHVTSQCQHPAANLISPLIAAIDIPCQMRVPLLCVTLSSCMIAQDEMKDDELSEGRVRGNIKSPVTMSKRARPRERLNYGEKTGTRCSMSALFGSYFLQGAAEEEERPSVVELLFQMCRKKGAALRCTALHWCIAPATMWGSLGDAACRCRSRWVLI